jgi:hypothetical protein
VPPSLLIQGNHDHKDSFDYALPHDFLAAPRKSSIEEALEEIRSFSGGAGNGAWLLDKIPSYGV